MTRHRHGIFGGETGGSVAKCRLFSQATPPASSKNMHDLFLQFFLVLKSSRDQGATETEDKARAKFLGGRLNRIDARITRKWRPTGRTGAPSIENVLVPKIA